MGYHGPMGLLPLRDAAREFGIDRTTLHRHIRTGRLRAFRRPMDRRTYIDRDELRDLLTFKPIGPTAERKPGDRRREAVADALSRFAELRRELRRSGFASLDAVQLSREARRELDDRAAQ